MNPAKAAKAKRILVDADCRGRTLVDLATSAALMLRGYRSKVRAAGSVLRLAGHRPDGMLLEDAIDQGLRHERRRGREEIRDLVVERLGMSWEDLMGDPWE